MKKVKKIKGFNRHLRFFLTFATLFLMAAGFVHLNIIVQGLSIDVGGFILPTMISYYAVVISMCMTIMGVYYLRALKDGE